MKTLGLIGGTTWVSSVDYYKLLNEQVNKRLGGRHSAQCLLHSFDFSEIKDLQDRNDWPGLLRRLTGVAERLAAAGAEAIMICANTLHVVADDLRSQIPLPVIHIAEATGRSIGRQHLTKVGLLGTKFTMEMDFFKAKLAEQQIETVTPREPDRRFVHATIFDELARGIFTEDTRRRYLAIMDDLGAQGAEGIVLGCTEIPLLVKQSDHPLPLFDTVAIHVDAGVRFALGEAD